MNDVEISHTSLEQVWDNIVKSARRSHLEVEDDDYFKGIFEGLLAALAELAVYMGRIPEYVAFCEELDELAWPFEGKL